MDLQAKMDIVVEKSEKSVQYTQDIKNDLKSGIIYNSIGKYSNVLISFIIQMVLARLLTPSEFGIVAVINIFLVFFQFDLTCLRTHYSYVFYIIFYHLH